MNVYVLITLKLILITLLIYFAVDSSLQFKTYNTESACLEGDFPNKLCAECFKRDTNLLEHQGYKVYNPKNVSLLKILQPQTQLTCKEYLQFIDNTIDSKNGKQFHLQQLPSVEQITKLIKATFVNDEYKKTQHVIQPQYKEFVVYKWTRFGKQDTQVSTGNPQNYKIIKMYCIYAFNFVLLTILIAWIADKAFLENLSTPVKLVLTLIALCMELYLFEIKGEFCLYLARLLVLNLGLLRLKVNNFKVIGFFIFGLILTYFPFTFLIYSAITIILLIYYGKTELETKNIKLYLLVFYTLLLVNHVYWYLLVLYLNDFRCLVVDLALITLIPTGIFLLPNSKDFVSYRPSDPEIRSISLSGYDQDEDSGP